MTAAAPIWDPLVRLFHWGTVAGVGIAFIAEEGERLHNWAGYWVGALLLVRLVWGVVGSRNARFASFVRGPGVILGYLAALRRGSPPPHDGHNPAGAVMILMLMAALAVVSVTGVLMTTNAFWGNDLVEDLHEGAANLLLGLVAVHVAAIVLTGLLTGENLVRAMVTGRK